MKGKISRSTKSSSSKSARTTSSGPSTVTKARPSFEGYQSGSRADIIMRDTGYLSSSNQNARNNLKSLPDFDMADTNGIMDVVGERPSRMSSIGLKRSGSAGILSSRMELDRF